MTALELVAQQKSDPIFIERQNRFAEQRGALNEQRKLIASPIVEELKKAGFAVGSIDELRCSGILYNTAIPILLHWLPLVTDFNVKESIVRALSVPWAKPLAALPLIKEFKNLPSNTAQVKWAIGNALSIIADDANADDLFDLVLNKNNGASREMIVVALANLVHPRAPGVLIQLLNDEEVCGHAIIAIGKLKVYSAATKVESFENHPKSWIRKEAKKTISKLKRTK